MLQEPLRVALLSHLRSLVQNLISNSETAEQISHILVNDNLDLGCALTETVATRKVPLRHIFFCLLAMCIFLFLNFCKFYLFGNLLHILYSMMAIME